ncbi:hypothetical protein CDD83_9504 [Cordyceps sp. RAO-2017]|nr:hypothetical protein CDD83_9504 [Cordyceps sp. RAO-2017]
MEPRSMLWGLVGTALAAAAGQPDGQQAGLGAAETTANGVPLSTRAYWMRRANQALAEVLGTPCPFEAFGAVIVNHSAGGLGEAVCIGANMRSLTGDHTMHGEVAAMRNCSAILTDPAGAHRLTPAAALAAFSDLSLYTTGESCPMCASAVAWARFGEYVYGTSVAAMVRLGWRHVRMSSRDVLRLAFDFDGAPPVGAIVPDVLANETDPFLAWQYDRAAPCPGGCVRAGGSCAVPVG